MPNDRVAMVVTVLGTIDDVEKYNPSSSYNFMCAWSYNDVYIIDKVYKRE